jgi:hypothetical protein
MVPYSAIKHIHEENQKFVLGLRLSEEELEALRQKALDRLRRFKAAHAEGGPSKEDLRDQQMKRLDDAERRLLMENQRLKAEYQKQQSMYDGKVRETKTMEKQKEDLTASIKNLQTNYAKLEKELQRLLEEEEFLRKTISIEDAKIAKIKRAVAFSTTKFAYLMKDKTKIRLRKQKENEEMMQSRQEIAKFERNTGKGFKKNKPAWASMDGHPGSKVTIDTDPMGSTCDQRPVSAALKSTRGPPKELPWDGHGNHRMNRSVKRVLSNGTLPFKQEMSSGQLYPVSTGVLNYDPLNRSVPSLRKPRMTPTNKGTLGLSNSAQNRRKDMSNIKSAW